MDLTKINQDIDTLELEYASVKGELHRYKILSNSAFAFTANWREKDSVIRRIPTLEKILQEMGNNLCILKLGKIEAEKQLQQEKEIRDAIEEERIAKENKIINPILLMDI